MTNRCIEKLAGLDRSLPKPMSNKYLEKVADLRKVKRMAGVAADAAIKNPMTTAFGAGGALDGLLSTTRQQGEGDVRLALRAARNTITGAAKGAAAGKVLELGYHHLKTKAASMKTLVGNVGKSWKSTPTPSKISLAIGSAGVGLSAANFSTNRNKKAQEALQRQIEIEQKTLATLRGIHRELKAKSTV